MPAALSWLHINLASDYVWRQSRKIEEGQFQPLRIVGKANESITKGGASHCGSGALLWQPGLKG